MKKTELSTVYESDLAAERRDATAVEHRPTIPALFVQKASK